MSTYRRSLMLVTALLLAVTGWTPMVAQERPAPQPGTSAVDLSRVPLSPADLPEPGFQLFLSARLELEGLVYSIVGDTSADEFRDLSRSSMRDGLLSFLTLRADPGDPNSAQIAALGTTIAEMDSEGTAVNLASRIVAHYELVPSTTVDGVMVMIDGKRDVMALMQSGNHLILMSYRFEEDQHSPQQNIEGWTEESIAGLAEQTGERLDDAIAMSEQGEGVLGVGNVDFSGDPALETFPPWVYTQLEYYRVLDGEVVPLVGEIEAPTASGITDLYTYYLFLGNEDALVPGDEDATIDIRISMMTFKTERFAAEFAASPIDLVPLYWLPRISYTASTNAGDGVAFARGTTRYTEQTRKIEGQIGSGYRAVQQIDHHVAVVELMATGQVPVTESAVAWLMERQAACIAALPTPCASVPIDQLGAILERGATPKATPAGDDIVIGDSGWSVTVPDDGWDITRTEAVESWGSDFFELQSEGSAVRLETVNDQRGDPERCAIVALESLRLREDGAVISSGSDDQQEGAAGADENHAWVIHTVESLEDARGNQEYTIRFDCYTLIVGEASLLMTHVVPRDLWTVERAKGQRLREGITLAETQRFAQARLLAAQTQIGKTHPVIVDRRIRIGSAAQEPDQSFQESRPPRSMGVTLSSREKPSCCVPRVAGTDC